VVKKACEREKASEAVFIIVLLEYVFDMGLVFVNLFNLYVVVVFFFFILNFLHDGVLVVVIILQFNTLRLFLCQIVLFKVVRQLGRVQKSRVALAASFLKVGRRYFVLSQVLLEAIYRGENRITNHARNRFVLECMLNQVILKLFTFHVLFAQVTQLTLIFGERKVVLGHASAANLFNVYVIHHVQA
jgi:hypothetical protein